MDAQSTVVGGIVIPSVSPVFLTIVAVHVAIALVAVASGLTAMLSPKGTSRPIRNGKVYFWSLSGVFASASTLALMRWAENRHLFIIGVLAFSAAILARTAIRRRWRNWARLHLVGMGVSYVLLLVAFYVDNGRNLPLWRNLPPVTYWLIPVGVGIPLIIRVLLRHPLTRLRSSGGKHRA